MGAYLDIAAMSAALKELYNGQVVENLVYKTNPLLALMPKKTDFVGKYLPQPIITGASQGRSSTFTNAQGNQSPAQVQEFLITRKTDYSVATITNETMLASATDQGSFLRGAKTAIDGAFKAITLSLASSMYRGGTGSIGQISATVSPLNGVLTLSNPNDVVQFEVNMVLQAAATDGGVPRAALGYVIAVDRTAGTVTVASTGFGGSGANPTSWATSDFLLMQGDSNLKVSGLASWLPTTAPGSSDNFYGVNRSVDPVRLAGVRYDGSSQSIEEALIDASQLLGREGGMPDYCFLPFSSYAALVKALGSKIQYVDDFKVGEIAFKGIRINGANTEITVIADRNCPAATAYLLQLDTWTLASLGEAPQILKYLDSNEFLRVSSSDAAELRVGLYGNVVCAAPGWNATIKLAQ